MICHTICHASSNRHSMLCCAILCCNGYSMLCCDVLVLFSAAVHHVHEAVSRWRRRCLLFYVDHFWKHCAGVCFQSGHHSSGHLVSDEDGKCQYQCILLHNHLALLRCLLSPHRRDVSNDAMREHDVSGLWKLHVMTSLVALLPLSLLFLLPHSEKDQEELSR